MATPYICENTIVKNNFGREGQVISVDRRNRIAVVQTGTSFWTTDTRSLSVLSYREVR